MAARVRSCRGRVWPYCGWAPRPCCNGRLSYRSVPRAPWHASTPCRAVDLPRAPVSLPVPRGQRSARPAPRAPSLCTHTPCAPTRLHALPSAQCSARLPYAQWAVAYFRFCIFFFFQLFPAIGKCPKNYSHFSLTLHIVKLLEKYFFSSYKFFFFTFPVTRNTKKFIYLFFFSFSRIL